MKRKDLMSPTELSVVVPVYGCCETLCELTRRIKSSIQDQVESFEIIFVDDRSPDGAWTEIEKLSAQDARIVGIRLARNFGQHHAITAGLDSSTGEWVVVMDCDLQDLPEEIPRLIAKGREGYDLVLARRLARAHNWVTRISSLLFYKFLTYLTGVTHDESIANFGIYNRKVVDAVSSMRESIRYFVTMVKWVGFESTTIDVQHGLREDGASSYNFSRRMKLALDIVLAYSDKPLRLMIKFGTILSLIALIGVIQTGVRWYLGDIEVLGYASLIISIWLLCGIIISLIGIVGLYVGKIFEGVRNRPLYIVDKHIN